VVEEDYTKMGTILSASIVIAGKFFPLDRIFKIRSIALATSCYLTDMASPLSIIVPF